MTASLFMFCLLVTLRALVGGVSGRHVATASILRFLLFSALLCFIVFLPMALRVEPGGRRRAASVAMQTIPGWSPTNWFLGLHEWVRGSPGAEWDGGAWRAIVFTVAITASAVLTTIQTKYGSYLLPMAYPEGSPAHPSYPAGHAAFAGAGTTMLKAFYNEAFVVPSPVVPSADGTTLVPYAGPPLAVGNELNKLASNIAIGRNASGVHWRSDGVEGMNLGEAAAIAVLQDLRQCYNEHFDGFAFTKFDGTPITI